jgi:hypothetical protein
VILSTYRRRIALLKPTPFQSQTAHTKHPSDARRCRIHVHDVDHFNRDPLVRDCSRWDHRRYLFQQRRPRTNSHVASKYERASLIFNYISEALRYNLPLPEVDCRRCDSCVADASAVSEQSCPGWNFIPVVLI